VKIEGIRISVSQLVEMSIVTSQFS